MKTVKQISSITGISVRTLHHYDSIGLLKPTAVTEAGYRLYDDHALHRLQKILLLRELGFPLKNIGAILDAPEEVRRRALDDHIRQLDARRRRLQDKISMAAILKITEENHMNLEQFDARKMDDYSAQARTLWGKTDAYKEYEKKSGGRSREAQEALGDELMGQFRELGTLRGQEPGSETVQAWVMKLQNFLTEHYYTCTKPILMGLGQMYAGGGSMTENIDRAGGAGTGEFARAAIEIYCDAEFHNGRGNSRARSFDRPT